MKSTDGKRNGSKETRDEPKQAELHSHEIHFNPTANEFVPSVGGTNVAVHDSVHDAHALPSNCVWVGNVCPNSSTDDFRKVFEEFGKVQLVRMFPNSKCAFVTFETADSALASKALEGIEFGTMKLTLNVNSASRHLWVGNVGPTVNEEMLLEVFAKFGPIESVRILRSNNCAFVNFANEEDALVATQRLNGSKIGDEAVVINFQWTSALKHGTSKNTFANKRGYSKTMRQNARALSPRIGDESATDALDVIGSPMQGHAPFEQQGQSPRFSLTRSNVGPHISTQQLWIVFQQFGEVDHIKRFADRGYCFVVFKNLEDAMWCKDLMTLYPPVLNDRPLQVNFGRVKTSARQDSRNIGMQLMSPPPVAANGDVPVVTPVYFYPVQVAFPVEDAHRAHKVNTTAGPNVENLSLSAQERPHVQQQSSERR